MANSNVQFSPPEPIAWSIAVRKDTSKFKTNPFDWYDVINAPEAKGLKLDTNIFRTDTDNDNIDEHNKFETRSIYASINLENGKK